MPMDRTAYYADASTPASIAAITAAMADAEADQIAVREIQTYKWANASERDAQAGMSEGDIGDQADTDAQYRYSGSGWVQVGLGPAFQVGRGSTQAIGANAWTLLSSCYGTPGLNVGFTSFSSGVLTIATSGWYRISLLMKWPTTANPLATQITVNSTSVDTSATVVAEWKATAAAAAMSGLVYLTAGDALRVYVFTTAAQNAGTNPRDIGWSVEYVRA